MVTGLNVGSVFASIGGETSGFEGALNKTHRMGMSWGRNMTKMLSAPIVAGMGASVKAFANFDAAMTQSTAIMSGVTSDIRKQMEDVARSTSEELGVSSTQAAESYFFLASAGLDATQSMAALPQVAKFAQAGMFDMATATDLATDAQSALGLTVDDAKQNLSNLTQVTDVLVKANALANASVEQFATSLTTKAAAAMRNSNIEMEEGVAVLAAFADQGIKGQIAGNGFQIVLRDMQRAAQENKEEFAAFGVEVFNSEGAMNNMSDIIGQLESGLGDLSVEQRRATLAQLGFQQESLAFTQALIGTSDQIRSYEADLRQAGGTTEQVANRQMQAFSEQMGITRDMIVNIAQEIGGMLVPVIEKLNGMIQKGLQWWRGLDESMQSNIVGFGLVAAAIGPVIWALSAMLSPIGLVVAGVTGLAVLAVKHFDTIKKEVVNVANAWIDLYNESRHVRGVVQTIATVFGITYDVIITGVKNMVSAFKGLGNVILGAFTFDWERIKKGFTDTFKTSLSNNIDLIKNSADRIQSAILETYIPKEPIEFITEEDIDNQIARIKGFASTFGNQIMDLFNTASEEGQEAGDEITGGMNRGEQAAYSIGREVAKLINKLNNLKGEATGLFPAGSLGAMRQEMAGLQEQLLSATDPTRISELKGAMADLQLQMDGTSQAANFLSDITQTFTNSFGQGLANVVVQGEKLGDTLKNIGKLLLSATIQKALSVFLTGGLGGSGFLGIGGGLFGSIFGGNRANGGRVFGGTPVTVGERGPETFVPNSGGRIIPSGSTGAMGLSPDKIGKAFSRALSQHTGRLGPDEIFVLSQKGRRSF